MKKMIYGKSTFAFQEIQLDSQPWALLFWITSFCFFQHKGDGAIGSYVGVLRVDGCGKTAMKYLDHPSSS